MSNPSFSNIDLWLFELHEGNLSPEQVAQLEAFLMQHPEFDVDQDMWELSYVDQTPLAYPHQDKLIKRKPVIFYWSTGAAAIFSMLLGIIYYPSNDSDLSKAVGGFGRSFKNTSIAKIEHSKPTHFNKSKNVEDVNVLAKESLDVSAHSINKFTSNTLNPNHAPKLSPYVLNTNENSTAFNQSINLDSEQYSTELQAISFLHQDHSFAHSQNSMDANFGSLTMKRFYFDDRMNATLAFENNLALEEEQFENWTLHRKSEKHKSQSFEYKFKDFKRAIQKMADNPIALKNLKDPHYHVPGMQAVDINFGAVGTLLATRVQTNSRYQWMGQTNDQISNSLLIDSYVYAIRGGIGVQVNQSNYHKNGFQNTFVSLAYSPKFSVRKNVTIEPAVRFKMGNQRIQPSKLTLGQMVEFERGNAQQFYSENEIPTGNALWYKDIGASVMVNTKWFYTGVQFDNLAQHSTNIYGSTGKQRSGIHTVLSLGTDYESKNKKLGFSPYIVYQNYEQLSEAWAGANFRASWFTAGAAVSSNLEPAASIGMKFKHFAVTYNADYTKSMLTTKHALSHQITLRFLTNPSRVGQRLLNY